MYHKQLRTTGEGLKDEDWGGNLNSEEHDNQLGMVILITPADHWHICLRDDLVFLSLVGHASCLVVWAPQVCIPGAHKFDEWGWTHHFRFWSSHTSSVRCTGHRWGCVRCGCSCSSTLHSGAILLFVIASSVSSSISLHQGTASSCWLTSSSSS